MKFLSLSFFFLTSLLTNIYAAEVGLKTKGPFEISNMKGNLFMHCKYDYGRTYVQHNCEKANVLNKSYSYIKGPTDKELKKIDLIVKNEYNPSYKMEGLSYKGKKGRTKRAIFLKYIQSFYQKKCRVSSPLMPLSLGTNIVEYKIYNKSQSKVITGSFKIIIDKAADKVCRDGRMFSTYATSCAPYNKKSACGQYFNYCKN